MIALAGSIVLGPRLGRTFKGDGGGPMLSHDLTIAASGGLLLWFGWYGFNPRSILSAMDFEGIGRICQHDACRVRCGPYRDVYRLSHDQEVGNPLHR